MDSSAPVATERNCTLAERLAAPGASAKLTTARFEPTTGMNPASACITISPRSGATGEPEDVKSMCQGTSCDQAGWLENPGGIAAVNAGAGTMLGRAAGDPPVLTHPAAPTATVAAAAHIPRRVW